MEQLKDIVKDIIDNAVNKYIIKGFVISNIGNLDLLDEYSKDKKCFVTTTKDDAEWFNYSAKQWAKILIFYRLFRIILTN